MNFSIYNKGFDKLNTDLIVVGIFRGQKKLDPSARPLDNLLGGSISRLVKTGDFGGKAKESLILFTEEKIPARRVLLVGLGKKEAYDLEALRISTSQITSYVKKFRVKALCFVLNRALPKQSSLSGSVQAVAETLMLSGYEFNDYKKTENRVDVQKVQFVLNSAKHDRQVLAAAKTGLAIASGVKLARDLGNHPGNVATPSHLAEHAKRIARESKNITIRVLGQKEIEKEKMGGLLAVAQGTAQEPKFIVMEYSPKKKTGRPTVLVGKGITFDSGGISIKPSERMEEMKFDMAGAATVMGIIKAAADTNLPTNLIGLIAATENLPGGRSMKPGDIITMRSGKSVEVVNTDAEGRLILADALDYAKKYKPDLVVDFATLTGAIVVSLGDEIIGSFTNDGKNNSRLARSQQNTGEKSWPMPLEKEYNEFLKSDFADLRNIGTVRYGDAINAALFLQNFVDFPWIHLDIAGVAWATREKPYRPKGATGTGVRLILDFLKEQKK